MDDLTVPKRKKRRTFTDRATLNEESLNKLMKWKDQISDHFEGMVKVSYTDLVNMILLHQPEKLSSSILNDFQKKKLSDVERAKWVYKRLLEAETRGEKLSFGELVDKAGGRVKAPRKRKIKPPKSEEKQPLN